MTVTLNYRPAERIDPDTTARHRRDLLDAAKRLLRSYEVPDRCSGIDRTAEAITHLQRVVRECED